MSSTNNVRTRLLAIGAAAVLAVSTLVVFAAPASADTAPPVTTPVATPATVSADALPTVQIDGVVWAQVVVGNTVYAAGSFATARPAGAAAGVSTTPRNNLLAYDITTGALITTFAPSLNGQALAIAASPDGKRLYVGGDFTQADGKTRSRIAAYDLTTNTLVANFHPVASTTVRAIVATNTTVYFGGDFAAVNGVTRNRLAAADAISGSLLNWDPNADAPVTAMTITTDGSKVVVGGRFQNMGGNAWYGLAAIDPTTGLTVAWAATAKVRDAGTQAAITSLTANADGVYGTGYVYGAGGNLEGTFRADPTTGNIVWIEDCHGDSYSVYAGNPDLVYVASHSHYCGNIGGFPQTPVPWTMYRGTAFSKAATGTITADPLGYFNWAGNPSPTLLNWFPTFINGSYTGQGQAGWSVTGNSQYIVYGGEFPSVNGTNQQGLVRFAISSLAPNKIGPNSNDGLTPAVQALNPGSVRVSWMSTFDRDNVKITYKVYRNFKSVSDTPIYTTTVSNTFWQRKALGFLDTTAVPGTKYDYRVYASDPYGNSVSRGATTITVPTSAELGNQAYPNAVKADSPNTYWRLGESSTTSAFDYIGYNDGVKSAGVTQSTDGIRPGDPNLASTFDGTAATISTPAAATAPATFSVEAWFKTNSTSGGKIIGYGAASSGKSGSYDRQVYLDNSGRVYFGVYPGSAKTLNSVPGFNDNQWHQVVATLGANGMQLFIDGKLVGARADVTTGQSYTGFWRVGGDNLGGWPGQPSSFYLAGSIDEVAIYGSVLNAGQVNNHFVAASSAAPVNQAPVAAFAATPTNLVVAFDGSTSTDDGSIASYAWDFGDGSAAGSGVKPSHTYAAAGSYTVSLTVTDNGGLTNKVTKAVTVTAAGPPAGPVPFVKDLFSRTVANGLGTSDLGGAWTVSGTASAYSVNGSAAKLAMTAPATAPTAVLASVSSTNTDAQVDVSVDKTLTGSGAYLTLVGRRISSTSDYRSYLKVNAAGQVTLVISKRVGGTETVLSTKVISGLTLTAGSPMTLRMQVSGTTTVVLNARVWKTGTTEPAAWQSTVGDSTAALAGAGAIGLQAYLSGSATNAPVVATFDNLVAQPVD